MPRNRFYNRRLASRAPASKHHLWRLPAARCGKPASARPRDRPGTAPDHLAVIRPPTAPCLTARRRLRADRLPTLAPERGWGRSAAALSADGCSAESNPLAPHGHRAGALWTPHFPVLDPFRPAHVNAAGLSGIEMPSIARDICELSSEGLLGALRPLAGGAAAARVHRCSKTSTRPLFARCSKARSRPRALVRLLQMNAPTSTTVDLSNIPNHRIRGWDGCRLRSKSPSIERNRRRYAGSGVEKTDSRRSPPRLLAAGTLPRPRSLRAASCRRHRPLPCPDSTREEDDAAAAAHACRARAA